jgi:hypothetical protein
MFNFNGSGFRRYMASDGLLCGFQTKRMITLHHQKVIGTLKDFSVVLILKNITLLHPQFYDLLLYDENNNPLDY